MTMSEVTSIYGQMAATTIFIAKSQNRPLSKKAFVEGGQIKTGHPAGITRATLEAFEFRSLSELVDRMRLMTPYECVVMGAPLNRKASLIMDARTLGALPKAERDSVALYGRSAWGWPAGPALMLGDVDAGHLSQPLNSCEEVYALLSQLPQLAGVQIGVWESCSSGLSVPSSWGASPVTLRGRSYHVAWVVERGSLIPAFYKILFDEFWARGLGAVKLSSVGSYLERCPLDRGIYTPGHLLYEGGCVLGPGLAQDRAFQMFCPSGGWVSQASMQASNASNQVTAAESIQTAKFLLSDEASRLREAARSARIARRLAVGLSVEEATSAERLLEGGILNPLDTVIFQDGEVVIVQQIMDNPDRYHAMRSCDPLEPSYGGDNRICYWDMHTKPMGGYSHAHGGKFWLLPVQDVQLENSLMVGKGGHPRHCLTNILNLLENHSEWRGKIAHDRFYGDTLAGRPCPIDSIRVEAEVWLDKNYPTCVNKENIAISCRRILENHQTCLFLEQVQLETIPETPEEREAVWVELAEFWGLDLGRMPNGVEVLRNCIVAGASRLKDPGCKMDIMPVNVGGSGLGKTKVWDALVGWNPQLIWDESAGVGDADRARFNTRRLLCRHDEMASLGKRGRDDLFMQVTQAEYSYVQKYKEAELTAPATVMHVGTCVEGQFAFDEKGLGERRCIPLIMNKPVNLEGVERIHRTIWAMALDLYLAGYDYKNTFVQLGEEAKGALEERSIGALLVDLHMDALKRMLEAAPEGRVKLSSVLVAVGLDLSSGGAIGAKVKSIRAALKEAGFDVTYSGKSTKKDWVRWPLAGG